MNVNERAWQVWPLLLMAARQRQTVKYTTLGELIGMPHYALGPVLEPIQSFCLINGFPPLTSIVVNKNGSPEAGYSASQVGEVPASQSAVYHFDWLALNDLKTPIPHDFEEAVRSRPSNGISTDEPNQTRPQ